jgi:hypothetical protein
MFTVVKKTHAPVVTAREGHIIKEEKVPLHSPELEQSGLNNCNCGLSTIAPSPELTT